MQIKADQLARAAQRQLLPVYLITGDEPLLLQETCDALRQIAREQGISERERFDVETGFDWNQLLEASSAMSLFGDRKLIELHMPKGKPGDKGGKALIEYCDTAGDDHILLIVSGKLEGASKKTKWYKTLDKAGAIVPIWPINRQQLPRWIEQRARQSGIPLSPDSVELIADRVEGNLLAADQEIKKLLLLSNGETISPQAIAAAVADSSRFNVFNLVDRCLEGNSRDAVKVLHGLQGEGTDAPAVLWALSREVRTLGNLALRMQQGHNLEPLFKSLRIWPQRQPLIKNALRRLNYRQLEDMQQLAADIDLTIKGMASGSSWDKLLSLTLQLSGRALWQPGTASRRY